MESMPSSAGLTTCPALELTVDARDPGKFAGFARDGSSSVWKLHAATSGISEHASIVLSVEAAPQRVASRTTRIILERAATLPPLMLSDVCRPRLVEVHLDCARCWILTGSQLGEMVHWCRCEELTVCHDEPQ